MCDVLLPPGVNPTAVKKKKYIYHIIFLALSKFINPKQLLLARVILLLISAEMLLSAVICDPRYTILRLQNV
jgi:hypothetical protein